MSNKSLSAKEMLIVGVVSVATLLGLGALGAPAFVNLSNSAGTRVAEGRQLELIAAQDEIKESEGAYADEITELAFELEEEGLEETASDLAQLTASDSGWCAVLNQDRGRMGSLVLTVSSDGSTPRIFDSIAEATEDCES